MPWRSRAPIRTKQTAATISFEVHSGRIARRAPSRVTRNIDHHFRVLLFVRECPTDQHLPPEIHELEAEGCRSSPFLDPRAKLRPCSRFRIGKLKSLRLDSFASITLADGSEHAEEMKRIPEGLHARRDGVATNHPGNWHLRPRATGRVR